LTSTISVAQLQARMKADFSRDVADCSCCVAMKNCYESKSVARTTNVWKSQFQIGPTTDVNEALTDATVSRAIEMFDETAIEVRV
jgi:hypothetical protein